MSYNGRKVTIKVESLKCEDIKYEKIYTASSKDYTPHDIEEFRKLRDDMCDKVAKENKKRSSDAVGSLEDFIKINCGVWDLSDTGKFILKHKKELVKLISKL